MKVLLYRRHIDLDSGAGQLIRMQAEGLKVAGASVRLVCQHGAAKFFLRTGLRVKRVSVRGVRALNTSDHVLVDHGAELPEADLVFVHNLLTEANLYLDKPDGVDRVASEAAFYRELGTSTLIVANSKMVRDALIKHYALDPQRIIVHYPGFQSQKFRADRTADLRVRARKALGIDSGTPLVGFITSGDLHKRGLDIFLAAAELITAQAPDVRFLVVGSTRLPGWAQEYPLVAAGHVSYRPKNRRPDLWLAALDVFLYAARFEEFGMVVSEAQALGVPVLTSRRVGAAECLPPAYAPWLSDRPDSVQFAQQTLALLADDEARRSLALAGVESVAAFDRQHYVDATVATILKLR